jgi:hypothetical protein
VQLVYYDDQGNPSNAPAVYAKLMGVDKVDLLISSPLIQSSRQLPLLQFGADKLGGSTTRRIEVETRINAKW